MQKTKYLSAKAALLLLLLMGLSSSLIFWSAAAQKDEAQAAAQDAQQNAANEANRRARLEQQVAALKGQSGKQRPVRVIVGLRGDFKAAAEATDQQARQAGREVLDRAQDDFLNKLQLADRSTIKKFRSIPFIVVEVNEFNLDQLLQLEEVESVTEDVHDEPSLAQSTLQIGAPTAWNLGFTGLGQTVAILDTGVDNDHSFLAGKVVSEACFSTTSAASGSLSVCPGGVASSLAAGSADNLAANISGFDHGTHVAGIAAGNGVAFDGVARNARIIAIQVFSRFNNQADCGTSPAPCLRSFRSDQMEGLERVLDLADNFNIAAVNMSLGGGNFTTTCDGENPAYTALVNSLRSLKIATVISSGNGGQKNGTAFPSCISTAISVGSVGDGSNGATQDVVVTSSQSASFLQLLAPGRWINSSVPGNAFGNKSGTSMAAPHVAGAFAVLKAKVPGASVNDLLFILRQTGVAVTDAGNGITKRRINLGAAINALCSPASYTFAPAAANVNFNGGPRSFTVFSNAPCLWQPRSNASWIIVTSPVSDTGNGVVHYQVQPHFGFGTRIGTITVAGKNHTVIQSGLF